MNCRKLAPILVLWCLLPLLVSCKQDPGAAVPQAGPALTDEELKKLREAPVKLLLVGSSDLAEELQIQFQGRGDSNLEVEIVDLVKWHEMSDEALNAYDVLIGPADRIASLAAAGRLLKFPTTQLNRWNYASWLALERRQGRFEQETYGVSLGTPVWAVVYNLQSVLGGDEELGSGPNAGLPDRDGSGHTVGSGHAVGAGHAGGEEESVPRTWTEWQQRIDLERQAGGELQWIEALADLGAAESVLLRAASMSKAASQSDVFISQIDGQPRIHTAPFVRALDELKATYGSDVQQLKALTYEEALQRVQRGEAKAALIPLPRMDDVNAGLSNFSIGPPLGSDRFYNYFDQRWSTRDKVMSVQVAGRDGLMACILRKTRKSEAAFRLVELLVVPPTDLTLAKYRTLVAPFRREHLQDLTNWAGRQYPQEAIHSMQTIMERAQDDVSGGTAILPALLGNQQRMEALNQAVWQVLNGELEAEPALLECRDKWLEITRQHGEKLQTTILQKAR